MNVLVIDVGGTHIKILASGETLRRKFVSGPTMTPEKMISGVIKAAEGWQFDAATIGYPGVVVNGRAVAEPHNLAKGWVGFDFEAALGVPVKLVNDATMQAIGSYRGGKMLFLGLGTGLGSAMIVDGQVESMELGHLPYKKRTYEYYVGESGRKRHGNSRWRDHVRRVVELLRIALEPTDVVLGGGNVNRLKHLPPGCRAGGNDNAFAGGFALWDSPAGTPASSPATGSSDTPDAPPTTANGKREPSWPGLSTEEERSHVMQIGMVGLGRMGANLARRLRGGGHECIVYDVVPAAVEQLGSEGFAGAATLKEFVGKLSKPRAVWVMVPAGVTGTTVTELASHLEPGDIIIDGGNSFYRDDIERAKQLRERGIHYVDCGTSGGIFGLERGFCLMIGGEASVVQHLDPIFRTISPGIDSASRTPGRNGNPSSAELGYLHCGPNGAGHFVKMVHNGIEYGMMAAYAEGLNILKSADVGLQSAKSDAETTPLRDPEAYQYELNIADVAEVWRRGSVVASWLLDLTAAALVEDPGLEGFDGRVSDSGEGRWTTLAAIEEGVPAPVISSALFSRFASRGNADFGDKLLSAMRKQFGGHVEKKG